MSIMMQQKQQAQTEAEQPVVPAGYKQTEVGVIPEDWDHKTIGELATVFSGGTPNRKVAEYWDGDIPWVTTTLIDGQVINNANEFITAKGVDSSSTKWCKAGSILMAMYGQGKTRGKVALLGFDATINQACAALELKDVSSSAYVLHVLNSMYEGIRELSNSGGQENLSGGIIKSIMIPLPPKKEQTTITNALSDMDALIGSLEALIAKKQAIKTATMQQLLTGRTRLPQFATHPDGSPKGYKASELGEIPEDWETATLGKVSEVKMCKRVLSIQTSEAGDIPFFKIGTFGNQPDAYIQSCVYEDFRKKYSFPNVGDILISAAGTLGKTVVYEGKPAYFQDSNIVWLDIDKSKLINEYLYHYYKIIRWASSEGSTIARLYNGIIRASLISLPSLQEQTAIATILSDMDEEIQALEQRLAKTRDLNQGMMQQLLTGKIRLVKPLARDEHHAG